MEQNNTPMIAKKIWNLMRVAYFMLRKGICKRKILMDLNLVMKRGKLASKALHNLMSFHHHHGGHHGSSIETVLEGQGKPAGEYEFSCSDTPLYRQYFTNKRKNHHNKNYNIPSPFEDMNNIEAVNNMFDMMMLSNTDDVAVASPALPGLGFGKSPVVKQLRITDSPFPAQNTEDGKEVDAAADDFIKNFYSQLKQQKYY